MFTAGMHRKIESSPLRQCVPRLSIERKKCPGFKTFHFQNVSVRYIDEKPTSGIKQTAAGFPAKRVVVNASTMKDG